LRGDTQLVPGGADAAFQHDVHSQFACNLADISVCALDCEG
jgi:hypothetical protein